MYWLSLLSEKTPEWALIEFRHSLRNYQQCQDAIGGSDFDPFGVLRTMRSPKHRVSPLTLKGHISQAIQFSHMQINVIGLRIVFLCLICHQLLSFLSLWHWQKSVLASKFSSTSRQEGKETWTHLAMREAWAINNLMTFKPIFLKYLLSIYLMEVKRNLFSINKNCIFSMFKNRLVSMIFRTQKLLRRQLNRGKV